MQRKIKELMIEFNIINKMIKNLRKRKEEVWEEIDKLEKVAKM